MPNQRDQGHRFERETVTDLKERFPGYYIATTRLESKALDAKGIDIFISPDGRLSDFLIQCKKTNKNSLMAAINAIPHKDVPQDAIPVTFVKKTKRGEKRETTVGKYAVLNLEDFYKLMDAYVELKS